MYWSSPVLYGTVEYSTVQYSMVQYSTVRYSTLQYSTETQLLFYHGKQVCKGPKGQNVIEVHSRLGHLKNISHPSLFSEEGPSCYSLKIVVTRLQTLD